MEWKVFLAIVETCVLFAVGGGALRIGYIGRDDIERWSRFTFNVFTPCLTFSDRWAPTQRSTDSARHLHQ